MGWEANCSAFTAALAACLSATARTRWMAIGMLDANWLTSHAGMDPCTCHVTHTGANNTATQQRALGSTCAM